MFKNDLQWSIALKNKQQRSYEMTRSKGLFYVLIGGVIIGCFLGGCRKITGSAGSLSYVSTGAAGTSNFTRNRGTVTKHSYWYYPSSEIYYDRGREMFFYFQDGRWMAESSLPNSIHINALEAVPLELKTERPYLYFSRHRKQYPPTK